MAGFKRGPIGFQGFLNSEDDEEVAQVSAPRRPCFSCKRYGADARLFTPEEERRDRLRAKEKLGAFPATPVDTESVRDASVASKNINPMPCPVVPHKTRKALVIRACKLNLEKAERALEEAEQTLMLQRGPQWPVGRPRWPVGRLLAHVEATAGAQHLMK